MASLLFLKTESCFSSRLQGCSSFWFCLPCIKLPGSPGKANFVMTHFQPHCFPSFKVQRLILGMSAVGYNGDKDSLLGQTLDRLLGAISPLVFSLGLPCLSLQAQFQQRILLDEFREDLPPLKSGSLGAFSKNPIGPIQQESPPLPGYLLFEIFQVPTPLTLLLA